MLQKKQKSLKRRFLRFFFRFFIFIPVLLISLYAASLQLEAGLRNYPTNVINLSNPTPELLKNDFSKEDIRQLIDTELVRIVENQAFPVYVGNQQIHVETSIDKDLQNYLLKKISKAKKRRRGKPQYLAIVVMEPTTGKIIALAGYNNKKNGENPCLTGLFPAASIFKIVTAAAAVEECGFTPYSKLKFNGGKYTLYKRQLLEKINRYTNKITFSDSFAQSVNPVFGKIGSIYLGKQTIEKYALAFGFNKSINFDTTIAQSKLSISDEPYQWAEVACGFNRETLISPIHAALLASAVVNNGMIPEPTLIQKMCDSNDRMIYLPEESSLYQAMKPETSKTIKELMGKTIKSGTGRKSFRGFNSDSVLKNLNIGGKTGSISNKRHDVRFDWFVGFAEEKQGQRKLAVSIVVGHRKYIGTRACNYARMTFTRFFKQQYSNNKKATLIAKNIKKNQTEVTR